MANGGVDPHQRAEKMEKVRRALRRIRQSRGRREPAVQRGSFFARLKAKLKWKVNTRD